MFFNRLIKIRNWQEMEVFVVKPLKGISACVAHLCQYKNESNCFLFVKVEPLLCFAVSLIGIPVKT